MCLVKLSDALLPLSTGTIALAFIVQAHPHYGTNAYTQASQEQYNVYGLCRHGGVYIIILQRRALATAMVVLVAPNLRRMDLRYVSTVSNLIPNLPETCLEVNPLENSASISDSRPVKGATFALKLGIAVCFMNTIVLGFLFWL